MENKIILTLKNAENDQLYNIFVSPEEAERLETDESNSSIIDTESEHFDELDQKQGEEDKIFRWPHQAILLLIEEYRLRQNDLNSGKMSQKKIWTLVAEQLTKHGYIVTGSQCLSKLSGLKRTYKTIVDHNNKSGNSARTWPYLSLMNELLGSKPFMSPISTVSSTGKRSRSPSSECSTSSFDTCLRKEEESQPKKARHTSNVERLVQTFKDDRKIAEAAEQKRHEENVELRQKLLKSFDRMLDIFEKK